MPNYKLTEAAFINDRLYAAGETVTTDLPPGPHMEPAKDSRGKEEREARAAKDAAGKEAAPAPHDPKFIGDLITKNVAGGGEEGGRDGGMMGQMAPPGIAVDAKGQVKGVTEKVGTGDAGDGTNAPKADGPGLPANPPATSAGAPSPNAVKADK